MSDVPHDEIHPPAEQRAEDQAIARADAECRAMPPTAAALAKADDGSAWPEGTSDPDDIPDTLTTRRCPDGGACGHSCPGRCWRVDNASPLSGVYPGDRWPKHVEPKDCRNCGPFGACNLHQVWSPTSFPTELSGRQAGKVNDLRLADGMTPERAHDIPMGVTGQPQYPTKAEMDQDVRDQLAAARLPFDQQQRDLMDAAGVPLPAVPAPIMPCGCTNVTKCRVHAMGPLRAEREAAGLTVEPPAFVKMWPKRHELNYLGSFKAEFDSALADAAYRSLRARDEFTAQGIPRGLTAEDTVALELKRGEFGPDPVTVQVLIDRRMIDSFAEMVDVVGEAMKRCADQISEACAALRDRVDPATGELRPIDETPEAKPGHGEVDDDA